MANKNVGSIHYDLDLKKDRFDRNSGSVSRSLGNMRTGLKKTAKVAGVLSTVLAGISIVAGKKAVDAYTKQEQALAQVQQGLESTGGVSKRTFDDLTKQAQDLQSKTIFGDEVILKEATSQLLTFTNITGTQFDRTQEAALDLATRLDGDLKSASIQLGKALNDPIANLSALSRSGIQFSDEQKEAIKALVETNRLADAQTIILDELDKQYGGSAEAAAAAAGGGYAQFGNAVGDVQEIIGGFLDQALGPLATRLTEFVQSDEFNDWIVRAGENFQNFISNAKDKFIEWRPKIEAIYARLKDELLPELQKLGDIIRDYILPHFQRASDGMDKNSDVLGGLIFIVKAAIGALQGLVIMTGYVIGYIKTWKTVVDKVRGAIRAAWDMVGRFIGRIGGLSSVIRSILRPLTGVFSPIIDSLSRVLGLIEAIRGNDGAFGSTKNSMSGIGSSFGDAIGARAMGGPVAAQQPYIVGERGPELFVPKSSGNIVPNDKLGGGQATSATINLNMSGMMARSASDMRDIFNEGLQLVNQERRARGEAPL